MYAVLAMYAGIVLSFLGLIGMVWPRVLGASGRAPVVPVLVVATTLFVLAVIWPAPDQRVGRPESALDAFMPAWQFDERHAIRVAAPPERVFAAIKRVAADDVLLFRTLTAVRRFGVSTRESILNPPRGEPILQVAARTGFIELAESPGRELVVGALVIAPPDVRFDERTPDGFKAIVRPGFAKAAMNFRVAVDAKTGGSIVTTETRVFATDASAKRRFAAYWRVIYPGSALIRRTWLRAIARRAEASGSFQ